MERTDAIPTRFRPPPLVTLVVPAAAAFLVQVPAAVAVSLWQRVPPGWAALSIGLAAASALALLAARRAPQATLVAVTLLTGLDLFVPPDAGPPFLALAFAIVGAVVRGARLWALITVGTAWVVAIVVGGILGTAWHPFRIAMTTVLLALCFGVGEGIRRRFERAALLRTQLRERRQTAEQDERTRIARELHDVLAHSLAGINLQLEAASALLEAGHPDRAQQAVASAQRAARQGMTDAGSAVRALREDARSLPDRLRDLVADAGPGAPVLEIRGETGDLDPAIVTALFRCAQEAVTNARRHAPGAPVAVVLEPGPSELVLHVTNGPRGAGRQPAPGGSGLGLLGMRERVAERGGRVQSGPTSEGGWRVRISVPRGEQA